MNLFKFSNLVICIDLKIFFNYTFGTQPSTYHYEPSIESSKIDFKIFLKTEFKYSTVQIRTCNDLQI